MMGQEKDYQNKLFITGFNLDKRVPKEHILRKIVKLIDFNFIYKEVKHTYGSKGNRRYYWISEKGREVCSDIESLKMF